MLSADFNQGTNGNTVSTSDLGNQDAWDLVSIGAGATIVYDTAHVNAGSLACKFQQTGAACTIRWVASYGTQTDHYGRAYVYITAAPTGSIQFMRTQTSATNTGFITILSTSKLRIQDAAANTATTTASVSTNQWVRVEWHILHSTTVGILEAKLFNTASSTTPTETITISSADTGSSSDRILFGFPGNLTEGPFWMDSIIATANDYPGPLVNNPKGFLVA